MKDEIIAELWQIKDELARKANYDVHVLCRELREGQMHSSAHVVDRSASFSEIGTQTNGMAQPGSRSTG